MRRAEEKDLGLKARRTQSSLKGQRRPLEGITHGALRGLVGRPLQAEGTAGAKVQGERNSKLDTGGLGVTGGKKRRKQKSPYYIQR